jgi:L-ascorbate metabolism protein UlaG (beta-lactamase superfamily)
MRTASLLLFLCVSLACCSPQVDTLKTQRGNLLLHFIGHGSLLFEWNGCIIHVDPVGQFGDYEHLPKADIILVTHGHGDHLDWQTIGKIEKAATVVVLSPGCQRKTEKNIVLKNGETITLQGIAIEAVPAYNILHMRGENMPYHPKGEGNGYVLTLADKRIYIAGDTENIPEMKKLTGIDVAFLPMNLPYTMTPEMVADAAKAFRPKILYPYHYGKTDPKQLQKFLEKEKDLEVRIRPLQ